MTEIVQKTDYDENLSLLLERWKNKPNFKKLLQAIHAKATDLETALFEIRDNYWLSTGGEDSPPVTQDMYRALLVDANLNAYFDFGAFTFASGTKLTVELDVEFKSPGLNYTSYILDDTGSSTLNSARIQIATPSSANAFVRGGGSDLSTSLTPTAITADDRGILKMEFNAITFQIDYYWKGVLIGNRGGTPAPMNLQYLGTTVNHQDHMWVYGMTIKVDDVLVRDLVAKDGFFREEVNEIDCPNLGTTNVTFEKYDTTIITPGVTAGGSAVGKQLDVLGDIFTIGRNGDTDEPYRSRIQQRAGALYSTPEDIIAAIKLLYGATYVHYSRVSPAIFTVDTDADISSGELNALAPAGVQGLIVKNFATGAGNNLVFGNGNNHVVV